MLLNYLYENFKQQYYILEKLQIDSSALAELQKKALIPNASYQLNIALKSQAFTGLHAENIEYYFYNKHYVDWYLLIVSKGFNSENQVAEYFKHQYILAEQNFLKTPLGEAIIALYPKHEWQFLDINDTWQHFKDGTYGLCTKSGLAPDIFLKHILGSYITFILNNHDISSLDVNKTSTLTSAINLLDNVTAQFAPHEVANTSRYRNIIRPRQLLANFSNNQPKGQTNDNLFYKI